MSTLLVALALLSQPAPNWVRPPAEDMRVLLGVRWKVELGQFELLHANAEEWTSPFISEDGIRAYAATRGGRLEARDLATSKLLWHRTDMGAVGRSMSEFRGFLLVNSDSALVALDQAEGRERWRVDLGGAVGGRMTSTGTVAVLSVRPNDFVAVDLVSHQVLWRSRRPTPDGITVRGQAPALLDPRRDRAYLGFSDGHLTAVSLSAGTTLWSESLSVPREAFADIDAQPLLLQQGEAIAAASYNGGVRVVRADDGTSVTRVDLKRVTALTTTPGGLVVAALGAGEVVGLHLPEGTVRWRYRLKRGAPTEPVVVGTNFIVVGASEGPMVVLEADSGRPVQVYDTGSGFSVPPFIRRNDALALSNGGLWFAMRIGQGQGISR